MRDPSVQCFGINTLSILHVSPFLLPMHVLCHVLFYMCFFLVKGKEQLPRPFPGDRLCAC